MIHPNPSSTPDATRRGLLRAVAALPAGLSRPVRLASVALPVAGAALAATPAAQAEVLIVLNSRDANVSLIDPVTYAEIGRVATGKEPHHLYPTPDGKSVIIANALGNDLIFLDPVTGQVQRRVRDIVDPYHLCISPDNRWFVTAANRLDHVDVYRWADFTDPNVQPVPVKRFALPKVPSHLVFTSDSRMVFATLQESDEVAAIDLSTMAVAWKLPVGRQPAGIAISPDDRFLFAGIMGEDGVDVIDRQGKRVAKRIRTGLGAHAFRPMGDRRHLFVSNRGANTISVIDMQTLQVTGPDIPVPGGPDCMEVSADGKLLYTTARWARKMTVVDIASRQVVKTVKVGASPHGVFRLRRAGML